jgi:ABC-type sulfate transport system permease component
MQWLSIMDNHQSKTAFVLLAVAVAAVFMSSIMLAITTTQAQLESVDQQKGPKKKLAEEKIK